MIGDWIRIMLTLALVYLVYGETGWATALCVFLMAARAEILDANAGRTFCRADSGTKEGR